MNLSLFTGFLPFPFGTSVHISLTFSRTWKWNAYHERDFANGACALCPRTMLLCLSNALHLARSFLPFLSATRIWEWFLTAVCRTDSGPFSSSVKQKAYDATA